jgi:hypothetical protein
LHSPVVLLSRHWASGTVLRNPTAAGFFGQKVELEKANMDGSPFLVAGGSGEVSHTDLTVAVEECAAFDLDFLLRPIVSGRGVKTRHDDLAPRFPDPRLVERRVNKISLAGRFGEFLAESIALPVACRTKITRGLRAA